MLVLDTILSQMFPLQATLLDTPPLRRATTTTVMNDDRPLRPTTGIALIQPLPRSGLVRPRPLGREMNMNDYLFGKDHCLS